MKRVKSVIFFPNGNTAVLDEEGNQIPSLQTPWILQFLTYLSGEVSYHSDEPDQTSQWEDLDITLPDGKKAKLFRVAGGGYNWTVSGGR